MSRIVPLLFLLAACHNARSPELRVLGVERHEMVFVQVTNSASRPMRLTKLEYTFASSNGTTLSQGEMPLERDVPANSAVVVEVPLDGEDHATSPMTLRGRITAELDQIVRIFQLDAQIQPH
jgi:hypothetical protein